MLTNHMSRYANASELLGILEEMFSLLVQMELMKFVIITHVSKWLNRFSFNIRI